MTAPVLELRDVSKRFPGVHALDRVTFDVRPGEVHAMLGENGAGKSTLIKIMAGVHAADSGAYVVGGAPVEVRDPRAARDLGVSVVFQELSQVASLSVAENVFFGRLPHNRLGLVDRSQLYARTREYLHAVGLSIDPATRLGFLSVAQRQLVEIARALSQDAKVIAMDEPTSALSHTEIETLFALIERLTEHGVGVVYVSHKLAELFRISDRITVLRDGRRVAERRWRLVGHGFSWAIEGESPHDPEQFAAGRALVALILARADERLRSWFARAAEDPGRRDEAVAISNSQLLVTDAEMAEINIAYADLMRPYLRRSRPDPPTGARVFWVSYRAVPAG